MRNRIGAVAVCLSAIWASAAAAQDKTIIEGLNARFAAAFNKADATTVASFYTEDASLMPAGAPLARGRSAIEAVWRAAATQLDGLSLTTEEVRPLGEAAASEVGRFVLRTKAMPPSELTGKYLVIWRRQGDGWKLDADIWNADR